MSLKFIIDGKNKIERTIEETIDVKGKTSIGIASGADINHCFSIALSHCKNIDNFLNDVNYYRICDQRETLRPQCAITIEFYK